MIEFIFRINNPFTKNGREQKDYIEVDKRISTNWAFAFQLSKWATDNLLEIHVDTSWRGKDHAGPLLYIELFGFMIDIKIYNVNHWNWDTGKWYTKEEILAELDDE